MTRPTLEALLGPQLDAMERICAQSAAGKHAGEKVSKYPADHHYAKADSHMIRSGAYYDHRDNESGEPHLLHAAIRLMMAANVSG